MIHLNDTLDNINNKFNYLLKFLCEAAKVQLKGLSLTSDTYIEARDLLNRYMNTHFLVSAYTKKLVLLPAICG